MTTTTEEGHRPQRADAQRNRERVLNAAELVFSTQGIAAPVDEVAAQAGVGVGTVYRHFPTKEALFEAIVLRRLDELLTAARAGAEAPDPGATFFAFVDLFGEQVANKRDLYDALASAGIDVKQKAGGAADELHRATAVLLRRAQEAGAVRDDIDADELFGLVVGLCQHAEAGHGCPQRMLAVVCDGLRTHPAAG